jgi:LysR family glycine cleavage system transcriptional activator
MKRTHLPLNGLRVLDAAARHLSFTRAADELAVTPAAVGQQIRALEDTLGVVLFRRTTKGLELTPEGEAGLDALRQGFLQFEEAVRAMQAGQSSKSLTIAARRVALLADAEAGRDQRRRWRDALHADRRRRGTRFHPGQSRPRDPLGRRARRA